MAAAIEVIYSSPDKCANLALACIALLAAFITILALPILRIPFGPFRI